MGEFGKLVDDALKYVEGVKQKRVKDKDLEKYVQHRVLRTDSYDGILSLEGETTNITAVMFGKENEGMKGLIIKDSGDGTPLVGDNSLRGAVNSTFRSASRKLGLGDPRCGWFDASLKQRFECGRCLKCGIMGYLNPGKGGFPHRLSITAGKPTVAVLSSRIRLSLDSATGRVPIPVKDGEDERKSTTFREQEIIDPGGLTFRVYITMRNMAPGEVGMALAQMYLAWRRRGVGKRREGKLTTWREEPGKWTMIYTSALGSLSEEVFKGPKLPPIINKLERIAYVAATKGLFREYEPFNPERPVIMKGKKRRKKK